MKPLYQRALEFFRKKDDTPIRVRAGSQETCTKLFIEESEEGEGGQVLNTVRVLPNTDGITICIDTHTAGAPFIISGVEVTQIHLSRRVSQSGARDMVDAITDWLDKIEGREVLIDRD